MFSLRLHVLAGTFLCGCFAGNSLHGGVLDETHRQAVTRWVGQEANNRPRAEDLNLPSGLSRESASRSLDELWEIYRETVDDAEVGDIPMTLADIQKNAEKPNQLPLETRQLTLSEEMTMRFTVIRKEKQPPDESGRALFICTHGSGPTPQEWQSQIRLATSLYQPEGVYFVPRMPEGSGKRWIRGHNQATFERVIKHAISHWGVDPNRVYKLGISQGGYATDKLTPFMPDRFAAGNAMASGSNPDRHPPENLRNVAFRTDVGDHDTRFNRVGHAIDFHQRLDELHAADPDGYIHKLNVQKGRGHGINYRPGVSWIAKYSRNPWPTKLVWHGRVLHDRRRSRHYWIQIDGDVTAHLTQITTEADRERNTITITAEQIREKPEKGAVEPAEPTQLTDVGLRVLLHDALVDLDHPVRVICNGQQVFYGAVKRSATVQLTTLVEYGDPTMTASAEIMIPLD